MRIDVQQLCRCVTLESEKDLAADIEMGDTSPYWETHLWMWRYCIREGIQNRKRRHRWWSGQTRDEEKRCLRRWTREAGNSKRATSLEMGCRRIIIIQVSQRSKQ